MKPIELVSFKDSIATKLLRVVFSVYFLVALSVTLIHMAAEYYNTQNQVYEDLGVFHSTFAPSLSQALWNMDNEQTQSILQGILKIPIISGVQVEMQDFGQAGAAGIVLNERNQQTRFNSLGMEAPLLSPLTGLFGREYPIEYTSDEGTETVGKLVLYSSAETVIEKVQYGFFFILTNALIKTIALWIIFLLFSRRLLSRPLSYLTAATKEVDLDNLENLSIDIHTKGKNELKILEQAFNTMTRKLHRARERTASLRIFFDKVVEFQTPSQMYQVAFQECQRQLLLTSSVLFDLSHLASKILDQEPITQTFLTKPPTQEFLDKVFSNNTQEVVVFNSITESNPIFKFYADQSNPPQVGEHFIGVQSLSDRLVMILRRSASSPIFDQGEAEFIKSMIREIKLVHQNVSIIQKHIRMDTELKTAAAVQKQLYPKQVPQLSNIKIGTFYESASETGGDWFGFIDKFENYLYILIGDVTGHGTPAALVAASASAASNMMTELYLETQQPPSPAKCITHLNKAIYEAGHPDFLMTFAVARIDLNTGAMLFCNAGHTFPILMKPTGKIKKLLNVNARLGYTLEWGFMEKEFQLEPGDTLLFYTDGLTENENVVGQMWGERELMHLLKQEQGQHDTIQGLVDQIVYRAYQFYEGYPLEDDVTIVACQYDQPPT